MQLSVILPCYNESVAIPSVINKLLKIRTSILEQSPITQIEILVVDDGSTDQSPQELLVFSQEIKIITLQSNQGYGRALKTGFAEAKGELMAFYDLDDTCQPEDLILMINTLFNENAGMVIGNRLHDFSQMPCVRRVGNWIYRCLGQIFLKQNISDLCSGMRVFRREHCQLFFQHIPDQLDFTLAMTVKFLKANGIYREVPIQYHSRKGDSKLTVWKDGPLFLWTLIKYSF